MSSPLEGFAATAVAGGYVSTPPSEGTSKIGSWIERGLSWQLLMYRDQPVMTGVVTALMTRAQEVEQAIADVRDLRSLQTSRQGQLDDVGVRLGLARDPTSLSDDDYRIALLAVAYARGGPATSSRLLSVALILAQRTRGLRLFELAPMEAIVQSDIALTQLTGRRWARVLRRAVSTGVNYFLRYPPAGWARMLLDDHPDFAGEFLPEDGQEPLYAFAEEDAGLE